MSTIVYNHKDKQIAYDSRETAGNILMSDSVDKCVFDGNRAWFIAGLASDRDLFISTFAHNERAPENIECDGFLVEDGVAYSAAIHDGVYKLSKLDCSDANGSGGWFALAAIDFGCSAEEAVKYAMTKDLYTGGDIFVYDVK